ncbi:MAG: sulfotransferase family 2 domain-containing protein [Paracoccaceae bacterium]|nr:sulfotransferase family 2 domain-containing protein [Maritimibacter sp.]
MPVAIKGTKLVYFPVPKVACTSIKTALLEHNDPGTLALFRNGPRDLPPRHVHEVYPTTDFALRNLLGHTYGKAWIAVLRDPIRRAVSGYRNRIVHHRDLDLTASAAFARLGLPEAPDLTTFALNLATYCRLNADTDHHFAPLTRYLGTKPGRFARVFRLSELDQFVGYVAQHGVHLTLPHEQSAGPPVGVDDLTDAARAALMAFYREDYEIWGDYF